MAEREEDMYIAIFTRDGMQGFLKVRIQARNVQEAWAKAQDMETDTKHLQDLEEE